MDISVNKSRTLFILAALLTLNFTINTCYAFSFDSWHAPQSLRPVVSIGGGAGFSSNVGKVFNLPIQDPITDEFYFYTPRHSNQTIGFGDAFLGAEWAADCDWSAQVGLGYNQTSPFLARGIYLQGADIGSSDIYAYRYHVIGRQLLVSGKLLYQLDNYHPYIYAGIGAAFNDAHHYHTNVPSNLAFTRIYANHTSTEFTYAVGVGVDMDVTTNMRLGVGYRFTDLGGFSLGHAKIDVVPVAKTLSQSHLYTNEVIAQLTYIFC